MAMQALECFKVALNNATVRKCGQETTDNLKECLKHSLLPVQPSICSSRYPLSSCALLHRFTDIIFTVGSIQVQIARVLYRSDDQVVPLHALTLYVYHHLVLY